MSVRKEKPLSGHAELLRELQLQWHPQCRYSDYNVTLRSGDTLCFSV